MPKIKDAQPTNSTPRPSTPMMQDGCRLAGRSCLQAPTSYQARRVTASILQRPHDQYACRSQAAPTSKTESQHTHLENKGFMETDTPRPASGSSFYLPRFTRKVNPHPATQADPAAPHIKMHNDIPQHAASTYKLLKTRSHQSHPTQQSAKHSAKVA